MSQDLGNSLSLDETLSLVAMRLRKLVPYDSIVAFIQKGDILVPEFVSGDNFRVSVVAGDPSRDRDLRLGCAELETHHQWESRN